MAKSKKQTCEECAYYMGASDLADKTITGLCRRYPPQPLFYPGPDDTFVEQTAWPMINGADWCGEYSEC